MRLAPACFRATETQRYLDVVALGARCDEDRDVGHSDQGDGVEVAKEDEHGGEEGSDELGGQEGGDHACHSVPKAQAGRGELHVQQRHLQWFSF